MSGHVARLTIDDIKMLTDREGFTNRFVHEKHYDALALRLAAAERTLALQNAVVKAAREHRSAEEEYPRTVGTQVRISESRKKLDAALAALGPSNE